MSAFFAAYADRRVWLLIMLGFSSGLPYLLTQGTLTTWLRDVGLDLPTIGLVTLVGLFYSLKFLWAPLLDVYRLPFLGRRRGWMLSLQLALVVSLLAMGLYGPSRTSLALASGAMLFAVPPLFGLLAAPALMATGYMDPETGPVVALAIVVAFLSSSQDVVIDAFRVDTLPASERASGTATFVIGYRLAMMLANAGALLIAEFTSWRIVYLVMAGSMSVGLVATLLADEPEGQEPPTSVRRALLDALADLIVRAGGWRTFALLGFVTLYRLGDNVAAKMLNPFLLDTGFSKPEIAYANKVVGALATVAGGLIGGGLVAKLGLMRSLLIFGLLQAGANVVYIVLDATGRDLVWLTVGVALDNLCGGLAMTAFAALLVGLCDRRFSATQYALLTAVAGVSGHLLGGASGYIAAAQGWSGFFLISIAAFVPAVALLLTLRGVVESAEGPGRE